MFTVNFLRVIDYEELVSIVTFRNREVIIVIAWNSNIVTTSDGRLLIPLGEGGLPLEPVTTSKVLITVGSKRVEERNETGCGFLIKGTAKYLCSDI